MSANTIHQHSDIQRRLFDLFSEQLRPAIEEYQGKNKPTLPRVLALTVPVERMDPLAGVEILREKENFHFYWEHPDRNFGLGGGGTSFLLQAEGNSRFEAIEEKIKRLQEESLEVSAIEHPHSGLHFLGGFSFDEAVDDPLWSGFGNSMFTIPEWLIIREGNLGLLTLTFNTEFLQQSTRTKKVEKLFQDRIQTLQPLFDFHEKHDGVVKQSEPCWTHNDPETRIVNEGPQTYRKWVDSVDQAKHLIEENKLEKIVLSRRLQIASTDPISPTRAVNRLRNLYNNCYCFMVEYPGSSSFIGCSPERLVQFNRRYILTDALAGSISRGSSATQDMVLENRLLNSDKNRQEHHFVVKAITKRLQKFTSRIDHPSEPVVKKLSNVQHLYTPIMAWIKEQVNRSDVLRALHPTPAVGGYPTEKALDYLPELELFKRGWYASPVGWMNAEGRGEFTVAIRSGLINESDAHFFAGCGIVHNSDAREEWEESKLKLIPMLSAVQHG